MKKALILLVLCAGPILAADPDFEIVVTPDPQILAFDCTSQYAAMLQWAVTNQNARNIKFVAAVGDLVDSTTSGQSSAAVAAFTGLTTSGMPWVAAIGNHDWASSGSVGDPRIAPGSHFAAGGYFNAASVSALAFWGQALPGGGGYAYWGGTEPTTGGLNYYVFLTIGSKQILLFVLEFYPRSAVMTWMQGIAAHYPTYDVWIDTHAYVCPGGTGCPVTYPGAQIDHSDCTNYAMGAAPDCNGGVEMWNGWLSLIPNLTLIFNGHFYNSGYYSYTSLSASNLSPRHQNVAQIEADLQWQDDANCGDGSPVGAWSLMSGV